MLRVDLEDAGIPYVDESGRYADFHSLRHSTGSLLAASGAHPKVAQALMRHSTIELTLGRYSHIYKGQESAAVAGLPDLSQPSRQSQQAQATGTNGAEMASDDPQKNLAQNLALLCRKQRNSVGADGQISGINEYKVNREKSSILSEKQGFPAKNGDEKQKAAVGFEPTNNGFAIRRLEPLGHAAEFTGFVTIYYC